MKIKLPGVKENVLLNKYTTFKIGGPAKYFFVAKNQKALIQAIKVAKNNHLPFFILGGGSNLLVSDRGYEGLVIRVQNKNYKLKNKNVIYAQSGVKLSDLVNFSVKNSLTGLAWAVGVPGTLGGAIYGNAGWPSNKKNVSTIVKTVEVLDMGQESKIKKLSKSDCVFNYRDSVFRHNKNLIILGASLQLKKGEETKIKREIIAITKKRKNRIPIKPSAGCIFKNPKGLSAGELIDRCGLKGKRVDGAQIAEKHANFIINLGGAKAKDVVKLIKMIKQKVKSKFKIELEEEIQYLGF